MDWFKVVVVATGCTLAFVSAVAQEGLTEKQRELIGRIKEPSWSSFEGGATNRYSSEVLSLAAEARPLLPALCEATEKNRSREAFETLDALGPMTYACFPEFAKAFAHLMKTSPGGKSGYNVGIFSSKLVREDLTPLQLVAFVEHPDDDVRWIALEALLQRFQGKDLPDEYVRIVGRRLEDDSPSVRDVAQRFLYGRPELGRLLLPELAEAFRQARLEEPDAMQRFREDGGYHHVGRVSNSLAGAIARCGEEAIDEVLTFLDHPSEPHRVLAVAMLTTMATPDTTEMILTHLDRLAKDPNRHVARQAIGGLTQLGGRSRTRLLIEILKQGPGDRTVAASHLGRLRDSAALEPLTEALAQTHDVRLRTTTAYALAAMGPMASESLPELRAAFASEDEDVRFAAASAVAEIGDTPEEAIAMLETFLVQAEEGEKSSNGRMRFYTRHAESALGKLSVLATDDQGRQEERLLDVLSNLDLKIEHYPLPGTVKSGLSRYGGERTLTALRKLLGGRLTEERALKDVQEMIATIEERSRTDLAGATTTKGAMP